MQKTLEQLMHERHEAYCRTKATDFSKGLEEWRAANRVSVAARDRVLCGGQPPVLPRSAQGWTKLPVRERRGL